MKMTILKAIVLCTVALSLLFIGVSSIDTDSGIVACHDGPHNDSYVY